MSAPSNTAVGSGPGGGAAQGAPTSLTECRAVGMVERAEHVAELANLLRSLCASYCTHITHSVVLRLPLPTVPGAPPGGTSTLLRLTRRLPSGVLQSHPQSAPARPFHPFLEDPPDRWEVRHEGPPLQGPALNTLPAAMREVTDTACYGAGALDFFKVLGGKLEFESYREGNEYSIVFHGYEIKVVLANLFSLVEPHVLRDASSLRRVSSSMAVEACLLVPEARHHEGSNMLGAFGAQLVPYVRLVRAEVLPGVGGGGSGGGGAGAAGRRK